MRETVAEDLVTAQRRMCSSGPDPQLAWPFPLAGSPGELREDSPLGVFGHDSPRHLGDPLDIDRPQLLVNRDQDRPRPSFRRMGMLVGNEGRVRDRPQVHGSDACRPQRCEDGGLVPDTEREGERVREWVRLDPGNDSG